MKRIYYGLMGVAMLMCGCGELKDVQPTDEKQNETVEERAFENGVLPGRFSVNDSTTVRFSQGNLQYQASTNSWRFANKQYEMIGEGNESIAKENEEWIDLFGWGTSGWKSGANSYEPYATSSAYTDYYVGGAVENGLLDDYAKADWGVNNAISNGGNEAGMWRTLTAEEWRYLLTERDSASALCSVGTVNGVKGLILLPDGGVELGDLNWKGGALTWVENSYLLEEWVKLHEQGVAFLPAAGLRGGMEVQNVGNMGCYWTASAIDEYCAAELMFDSESKNATERGVRFYGRSVRLVR